MSYVSGRKTDYDSKSDTLQDRNNKVDFSKNLSQYHKANIAIDEESSEDESVDDKRKIEVSKYLLFDLFGTIIGTI